MKVNAHFVVERKRIMERVDHMSLTTPYAPPQIETTDRFRFALIQLRLNPRHHTGFLWSLDLQRVVDAIKFLNCVRLFVIGDKIQVFQGLDDNARVATVFVSYSLLSSIKCPELHKYSKFCADRRSAFVAPKYRRP